MSLGLLGEYGSDSSSDEENTHSIPPQSTQAPAQDTVESQSTSDAQLNQPSSQSKALLPQEMYPSENSTSYDPFGFSTSLDDVDTSSSCESEQDDPPTPSSTQATPLPLPDFEAPPTDKKSSSVFSNPYKEAEEERLSILKHHVKEFAPEVKEKQWQQRRKGKRGAKRSLNSERSDPLKSAGCLFDDSDAPVGGHLGRRKVRSGVGDSLVPAKKFMKVHSEIQAREKPWTAQ